MTYRLAETSDAKLYFDWANDPEVRKQSHSTDPIIWENHLRWFNKVVNSALMLIFFDGGTPVAQIRLADNTISMSVDATYRVKGVATYMLKTLKDLLIKTQYKDLNKVSGEVKQENIGSIKAFENAQYRFDSVVNVNGGDCNMYFME